MDYFHFCEWTQLDSESKEATLAWVDFQDQDLPLVEWWAEYQGRYV